MSKHTNNDSVSHVTRNLAYFDDRTALHLTQAFAQEVDLEPLLELLFKQLKAIGNVSGMGYVFAPLAIQIYHGDKSHHCGEYNLSFRDLPLGTLSLYFPHQQHEQSIQTCEDLVSMAFLSIRNALTTLQLRHEPKAKAAAVSVEEKQALGTAKALPKESKSDALILLALDDYPAIKSRDGDEWAQVLMSAVHEQIREGLRGADGVYHIGDDLIAVLLPNTTASQAEQVARKVRTLISSLHLRGDEVSDQLTACMGLADAEGATNAEAVMKHAKQALADAQTAGKNEIRFYKAAEVEQATA